MIKPLAALLVFFGALLLPAPASAGQGASAQAGADLEVMAWNIWHGGREDGKHAGPEQVAKLISESGVDLVALQETYGSGELLAEATGMHLHARGTNVSILSRFPVIEDLSVHEEFQNVGALVELPDGQRVAFYSVWLPFRGEIWLPGTRDTSDPAAMEAVCEPSAESLGAMWKAMGERLAKLPGETPVIVAGDFNSMSHLDYGEVGLDQYGVAVDWATSKILMEAGFLDSYRGANPVIDRARDATWSPRFPLQERDRIDFVYYRGEGWSTESSRVIRSLEGGFPSDHGAVVSRLRRGGLERVNKLVAATYNIKHGAGMDGEVDLRRTAAAIGRLKADFVALQEVDLGVKRSGHRNQMIELARELDMHPAFGSFMEHQGGEYGMGFLSRFPIVSAKSLRLPDGNEPRVALVVESQLPTGQRVVCVNVHFDWVEDNGFRLAQARVVRDYLAGVNRPWILLGDFNDVPDSETLALFREIGAEVPKARASRNTFPADHPAKEIDFIFRSKGAPLRSSTAKAVNEPSASDHRPVLAEFSVRR